jgi:hypothetical protein
MATTRSSLGPPLRRLLNVVRAAVPRKAEEEAAPESSSRLRRVVSTERFVKFASFVQLVSSLFGCASLRSRLLKTT